ncbi:Type I restriction modification DNA specificity domain protein [Lactobacillus kullabergensis]|uniref:Type I restriction modification DNA specificity domain protein n=1 Tax=Lactobacillus kullabergensis TaxID=1218493 RepID=A0A0F4LG53_9LACO|nr:restriction endonuclease subunit S [Lactobacillus kullabergensis]KJY57570.1 Type I restriction modification DNA specificity domain protein [Lactobacillus kullabergensis]
MNEHKAVPNIRFNGFEDVWKSMKFKNILNYERPDKYIVKSDNYSNNGIPVLTANKSFILGYTLESSFYEKPLPIIIFDDFTLDCKLVKFPFKIKSSAIKILSSNNFSDIWFDFYLLKATSFIKEGHARHYISIVQNKKINVPDKQEQQKIGNFFAKLDKLLDLQQQKIDKLELLKKTLLQKLFPKHDAKIPELRFKGCKEDWRDKKTLELVSERNSKIIPNDDYPLKAFIAKKGISEKGEKYNRSFLVKSRQKKYKKTEYGDLIYSSNNLEVGSIGINRYGNACISPVYSIFKVNNSLTYDFLGYLIQRKEFIFNMIRYRQGVTYGQWKIHESDFLNIQVLVPETIDEQQKIGNLLSKVDQLIELANKKLQNFQQIKKCLLQNMFVE